MDKSLLRKLLPRSVHPHRIWAGPVRSYLIVTSWHDYPAAIMGRTERHLLEWFAANVKPGETWLDIGAHYGYTAIALSRLVGNAGRVFAFEPMLSTAGYLTQTRLLNHFPQLAILPLGLASPESFELQRLPTIRGMVDSTQQVGEWQETVLVARFDWLWTRICEGQSRIDGVKIDVQGMEIEVLRGMVETLRADHPKVVVEVHAGVNRVEMLDLLVNVGYEHRGQPIEPVMGEVEAQYVDNHSYAFRAVK